MFVPMDEVFGNYIQHEGRSVLDGAPGVGSGRYPFGSGENPYQHEKGFNGYVNSLRKQGLSDGTIAKGLGFKSSVELRAHMAIEKQRQTEAQRQRIVEMRERGMSVNAIAKRLGIPESTARNIIDPAMAEKRDKVKSIADILKEQVNEKGYIDVGKGVELSNLINVSPEKLNTAVAMLKEEGYKVHYVPVEQLGNPGKFTTVKTLGGPDSKYSEVFKDPTKIKTIDNYIVDDGKEITSLGLVPPKSIDSSRVKIRYAEEGGTDKDGVIELRRGVDDISLDGSKYAQVRIGVDDKYYMKGMAIYSDNMPDGVDVIYNSNKKLGTPKESVFKPMKTDADGNIDPDNPFGASIKPLTAGGQSYYTDANGNKQLRVINKVNDQGDWQDWSRTISAQVLAKQPLPLVKRQLDLTYQDKLAEFEEIKSLTNPTIKRKLLDSYADDCDASAVHLKAKAFPGQASHVILPVTTLKDDECYAPNYEHGAKLALVRYPHAGTFEIPIVTNNTKNKEALSFMRNAPDAIGINSKVAERLSGADYDGDTVTAIPTSHTNIKSTPRLAGLVGFDPKIYKRDGLPEMKSQTKQTEMGKITNLIADMQIKGAQKNGLSGYDPDEVARAVKHSMVVIDAQKHGLDYKQSYVDNGIAELKAKYQDGKGASTLITRAGSEVRVPAYKTGYKPDPVTGEVIKTPTGESYTKARTLKSGEVKTKEVPRTTTSTRMAETNDARTLMSSKSNPHPVELAYANYANKLKSLANEARKESMSTPKLKLNSAAKKTYAAEVDSLNSKLNSALKHAPVERQAQILAGATVKAKKEANPGMTKEEVKKLNGQALNSARTRLGGKKQQIQITDREWEAIQAGAISDNKLKNILDNTNSDTLRKRATPRASTSLSTTKLQLARSMDANGYTNKEIAERLGISVSSVSKALNG